MSTRQFREVCQELHTGKALWALLTANEYLDANSALHAALRKRAQERFERDSRYQRDAHHSPTKLLDAALSGSRLQELPQELQEEAQLFEQGLARKRPRAVVLPQRRSFRARKRTLAAIASGNSPLRALQS